MPHLAASSEPAEETLALFPFADIPLIDAAALEAWSGDLEPDDVADVLSNVPDEAKKSFRELRQAIEISDLAQAKRIAHRMKGMAGNLGAARLSKICREIEISCVSVASVSTTLPELRLIMDETLAAFREVGR